MAKEKLDLLTDVNILLMIKNVLEQYITVYYQCIIYVYQYVKSNNKYIKDYDKNKESAYLHYWDVINLYDWAILQTFPLINFEWIKDTFQFNEDFIKKAIAKKVIKDIFSKTMFNTWNN